MTEFGRVITQNEHNFHNGKFQFVRLPADLDYPHYARINFDSGQAQKKGRPVGRPFYTIYSLDRLAKHLTQQVCHALRGLDGGDHQQVAIHLRPVEVMSRAADKLRQERPLGAPVALAEGVQVVGGAVEVGDLLHEGVMGQALEVILLLQSVKNQLGLRFDHFGGTEVCPFLAEVHRADLPCPIVQVREKKLMDRLIVGKVKNAFQRALFQLGGVDIRVNEQIEENRVPALDRCS